MKNLNGKIAFVTGASSGIGYALAEALGHAGVQVMIAGVNEQNLDAALARLRAAGITAERVQCDVASRASVQSAALATIARFGKVHVVCNNAGVGGGGAIGEIVETDWNWIVGVNLMGVVHGTETFAPLIAQHGEGGHIVNTSSIAGMLAGPGMEPYCATKFAVVAMSEGWRAQLAPRGIGVSVLCPAFVRTNIGDSQRNRPAGRRSSVDPQRDAMLKQLVAGGMEPAMLAARVLEAIADDELYIFTHAELKPAIEARFQNILAALDTAARSPALKNHKPQELAGFGATPGPARP
jgi:NAD(P)-dependent dehydrogenase (short-subunit alcohol dehydrogenase family)